MYIVSILYRSSILLLMLLGNHLIFCLDLPDLVTQLFNVLLLLSDLLLQDRVELLRVVRVRHKTATRRDRSALLRLLDILKHLLAFGILLEDLVELFGAAELVELDLEVLDAAAESSALLSDLLDQQLVGLHHKNAVLVVLSLLASQFIVKCINRLLKELHLHFVLLLNVTVLNYNLLVVLLDEALQLSQHAHLQLLVVVDVLRHPVDSVLERPNVAIIVSDVLIRDSDCVLQVLLFETQIFHDETQVGIE